MFEYEGEQYTLADLQKSAAEQGYDNFEEFMQMYINNGMRQISEAPVEQGDGFDDDMSIMQGLENFFGTNLGNIWTKRVLDIKGSMATFFEDFDEEIGQAIIGDDGVDRGPMGLIDPITNEFITKDVDAWRSKGYDAEEKVERVS